MLDFNFAEHLWKFDEVYSLCKKLFFLFRNVTFSIWLIKSFDQVDVKFT